MTRPIDADRVTENLQSFVDWCRDGRRQGAEFCLDCVIPNTPTLEAVPVVRCKDCKYSSPNRVYGCRIRSFADGIDKRMYADDFCSLGEKKEE